MAHQIATVRSPRPPADVFAYLADFSTTQEWDPGVAEAAVLGDGTIGLGARIRVVADFMGSKTPLVYEITEYDPPAAVTLRGENATVVSLDRITVVPDGDGSLVTYDADLRLKGVLRLADPLLGLVFGRIADKAVAGLRDALAAPARV